MKKSIDNIYKEIINLSLNAPTINVESAQNTIYFFAKNEALKRVHSEEYEIIKNTEIRIKLLLTAEACCLKNYQGQWEININTGLIEVLYRLNFALMAYGNKAPVNIVNSHICLAIMGYLGNPSFGELIYPLLLPFFDRLKKYVTPVGERMALQITSYQLQFVILHEYGHIIESVISDSPDKTKIMYFDGLQKEPSELLINDESSEIGADEYAGLAIGGFFDENVDEGFFRLSCIGVSLHFFELCKFYLSIPLLRNNFKYFLIYPKPIAQLDIDIRLVALNLCRVMIYGKNKTKEMYEKFTDSYILELLSKRLFEKTRIALQNLPDNMSEMKNIVLHADPNAIKDFEEYKKKYSAFGR